MLLQPFLEDAKSVDRLDDFVGYDWAQQLAQFGEAAAKSCTGENLVAC